MRISDRSSDVCSSDLKAPLVLCPAFLEIWRPGDAMRFQTVKIIGKQIALMVASVANRKRGRNDVVHIVHVMAAYDELPIEQARTPIGKRSEEHTSELQSLMRNSYAVFCLQKKNHTIQTQSV